MKTPNISENLVTELIREQFPQWERLPIKAVEFSGIDNRTFRLGDTMLVRLPSAEGYAAQVEKEQYWLPKLAPQISLQIPVPIAMGKPSQKYPWHWSVYKWIAGQSANALPEDTLELNDIAKELASFLKELHRIDSAEGPPAGPHNYYRGANPSVYDAGARADIARLKDLIDAEKALIVWEQAINTNWTREPVWIHGDFAFGNFLIEHGRLKAIIDFGCMGVGDPACDLVIAWTFLKGESREIFEEHVGLDQDTWNRAKGWALWKANFELAALEDKSGPAALKRLEIIKQLL